MDALMQNDAYKELMELGSKLSLELRCPVKYPVSDKNMFECKCGIRFPVYMVKAGNWAEIRKLHKEGGK